MLKRPHGFSLIEVLVTLLLVTTGVLGMVAMQARAIQYTQDSVQRNAAVDLANELVELMRANPDEVFTSLPPSQPVASGLKGSSLFYKPRGGNFSPAPGTPGSGDCAPPSSATDKDPKKQRDCWLSRVEASLPGASDLLTEHFYVCRSSAPSNGAAPTCDGKGSVLEIQLAWAVKSGACPDDRAPNATTCIYRTRVEL